MIIQPAKVIAETDSSYLLETLPKSACPRCESGKGCGGGILAQAFANKTYQLSINKNKPLLLDEMIQVGIKSTMLVRASMVLYLVPLIFMVSGAVVIGNYTENQDLYTVIAAICGFLIGVYIARILSGYFMKKGLASPVLVEDDKNSCWFRE